MPLDDSKRWQAVSGLVQVLQTITPANGYRHDFSGAGCASSALDTIDARKESGYAVTLRVRTAEERFRNMDLARNREASLVLVVDILANGRADDIERELNEAVQEVHLAINDNRSLMVPAAVSSAIPESVDAPEYDAERGMAQALFRVRVIYDFAAGQWGGL